MLSYMYVQEMFLHPNFFHHLRELGVKAIRDSIIEFIENYEKFDDLEGYKIMTINLIYPIEAGLLSEMSEICDKYRSLIKTMMDWRIASKK
ncbi:unnamed protein product, partial [marine sediment metagenome]